MSAATRAAIGLGGNVGDVEAAFRFALERLSTDPHTTHATLSPLYATAPWGGIDQPRFLNAVAVIETTQPAQELMQQLLEIERAAGRDRANETRWGPRRLDLDLLLHGESVIDSDGLQLPHPRLAERAFALVPLLDVWPDAVIPGDGPARQALERLTQEDVAAVIAGRVG
ncbi:2-amino-4-hydroxy-6-hydroxymethyldihydropteridine diphosphokinase [Solilutibacter silvestris]|uniref:2-amino-4-hydroxy-6-hydroxymethyldihydropteridine pyrophosphokinase n=1 Tax=Solilutibacter silvestris TaxID=1645665 RepID=A0A2K1PYW0_9GAMM|nr:2-amino-4-hydroxy-6-hydroxymethyldihydropteridine diphosphokinase [Lysobacter silvestris]PNS07976.1 folK: 2-amino-4-hydroxy-6-hydroxymethyldihydropteridine diphosphokinase [Lysobacter silvestris]